MRLRLPFVRRLAALPSDDSGSALVFVLGVFLFLFVLVLSVYSVGENIRRKEELQNACDAAAYSAAVVQADGLSRMAVINRAMAWTHTQTTKMQMDYITYKWLKLVRDRFGEDMKNIDETEMADFGKPEMGYHHLKDQFPDYTRGNWLGIHFSCHDGVHDNPHDARARYIGLGPNTEGGYGEAINVANALAGGAVPLPDWHWIRINGFDATERRLQYDELLNDLWYCEGSRRRGPLIASMESAYGFGARSLGRAIDDGKEIVRRCGAMLKTVNAEMAAAIPAAARATLYANLPRKADGAVDSSLLEDYVFAIASGAGSCDPYDPSSSSGKPIYYDPLYNCEEDEMRFLAMANGLSPKNRDAVTLKDFYSSPGVQGGGLAAGLDQWFIRCDPDEAAKDALSIPRRFAPPPKGIVRCYKNANYKEGRTGRGVLRGNYCLDGNGLKKPQKPSDIDSVLGWSLAHYPKWPDSPWWMEPYYFYEWLSGHLDVQSEESRFKNKLQSFWSRAPYSVFSQFSRNNAPSCVNYRTRYIDQCANVNNRTWGLYAEYEWAAAYWFCCWLEFKPFRGMTTMNGFQNFHIPFCIHIPIPSAVFGGRNRVHYGDSDTPSGIAGDQRGPYNKGSSRSQYRRTFIGADGERRYECPLHGGDGDGANMGAKGYVRIYGDDKEIIDGRYVGAVAKPWVLNERFFRGMGTILVGVARKQRNVFSWAAGENGDADSLFAAFTPDKAGRPRPRIVALAAARAAYAPRTGTGDGGGGDSENDANKGGGKWGRHYELRYDAVTSVESRGNLRKPSLSPYNGQHRNRLEDMRIGCVCGSAETGQRLRRQWNLSQTDWDAVLLPVRHAYADPRQASGEIYDSRKAGAKEDAYWSFSESGGATDPQFQLAEKVLPELTWVPLSGAKTSEKWNVVGGMDGNDTYRLFKKRLVH